MLIEQKQDFLYEFQELCAKEEEKKYAKDWIEKRYVKCRANSYEVWTSLAVQFCNEYNIEHSENDWGRIFAHLHKDLWVKYLQAGLNEMAANFK